VSHVHDAFAWFTASRVAVLVAVAALVIALTTWLTSRRAAGAAERQAESSAVSARHAKEGVEVSKRSAEAAETAARASQDEVSAAWESVRQAERQLLLDQQMFADQNQPYVYADIRPDDDQAQLIVVVIENLGRSVATDIVVDFDPPLQSTQIANFANVSQLRLGALAPNRRYKYPFDVSFRYLSSDKPLSYQIRVSANGPHGPVGLSYDVNLDDLRMTAAANKANLRDVVAAISDVSSSLRQISARTMSPDLLPDGRLFTERCTAAPEDDLVQADDTEEWERSLAEISVPLNSPGHPLRSDGDVAGVQSKERGDFTRDDGNCTPETSTEG
jgi:hypothetical protein